MALHIDRTGPAEASDIEILKRELGVALPEDYVAFVETHDGARPPNNIFEIGTDNSASVDGFIPVQKIPHERKYIGDLGPSQFPFAWASCGNYVILDADSGKIHFWDHEVGSLQPLAFSFSQFLEKLEAFDPDLDDHPGKVISVWVRPGFLESLKQK